MGCSLCIKMPNGTKDSSSQRFSLQSDESSDTAAHAQLLAYIRYIGRGDATQRILFWELPKRAAAEEIFKYFVRLEYVLHNEFKKSKDCFNVCIYAYVTGGELKYTK